MGKDIQDSANKAKEGLSEGAWNLKNKATEKMDEFKASTLSTDSTKSNMMLWGTAGATAGALVSLFVLKNAALSARLATIGGMGGAGAYFGNRYSHRTLARPKKEF